MKKLILIAIMLSALNCNAQEGFSPDKKTMSVIKKAEIVEYCALDPWSEDFIHGEIYGIAKTGYSRPLRKDEKDSVAKFLHCNKDNCRKLGKGKFCPPAPQDALLFTKGSDTITIVFDFNCAAYTIVNDTVEYEYDFDNAEAEVSKLIKQFRQQDSVVVNAYPPVDTFQNMLTEKMRSVIGDADSVVCYLLDPLDKTNKDTLNGFCILNHSTVDAKHVDLLKKILLDKQNFVHSDILKNCTFLCDMIFRVYAKGEYADVMFAFYCDDCVVVCGDEHVNSDSSNMRKGILEIAKDIFPKDRYIRHLLNQ